MITLRRAEERHHEQRCKQDVWQTFHRQDRGDPLAKGFGTLKLLDEFRLPPGADSPRYSCRDAEIITYVVEGALAHHDSMGGSGVINAGEFQHRTVGRGIRLSETNASPTHGVHVFQIWLRPWQAELEPEDEEKRFFAGERRSGLCNIASHDGRRGSLAIHQDALLFSAILEPGQHVVHELEQGRSAWVHLVLGEVSLDDKVLTSGDSAGFRGERAVSLTAREPSEILLLDLGEPPPGHRSKEGDP